MAGTHATAKSLAPGFSPILQNGSNLSVFGILVRGHGIGCRVLVLRGNSEASLWVLIGQQEDKKMEDEEHSLNLQPREVSKPYTLNLKPYIVHAAILSTRS